MYIHSAAASDSKVSNSGCAASVLVSASVVTTSFTWSGICRAKASMNAAADGQLAAKSNNPFAASGTDTAGTTPDQASQAAAMDEGDIEAEGIESALVSLERVTALLTINAAQGISPGMKVTTLPPASFPPDDFGSSWNSCCSCTVLQTYMRIAATILYTVNLHSCKLTRTPSACLTFAS